MVRGSCALSLGLLDSCSRNMFGLVGNVWYSSRVHQTQDLSVEAFESLRRLVTEIAERPQTRVMSCCVSSEWREAICDGFTMRGILVCLGGVGVDIGLGKFWRSFTMASSGSSWSSRKEAQTYSAGSVEGVCVRIGQQGTDLSLFSSFKMAAAILCSPAPIGPEVTTDTDEDAFFFSTNLSYAVL